MRRFLVGVGTVLALCLLFSQAALAQFDDAPTVDSWVYESFRLVYDAGLIKGYPDGTFRGERPATRNEVVEFLARLMKYFDEKLAELKGQMEAASPSTAPVTSSAEEEKTYLTEEDVKAILEEELAAQGLVTQEDLDTLAEDLYAAIQDLEEKFRDELDALDVRVTILEEKVAALEEKDRVLEEKDKEHDAALAKLQADLAAAQKALDELKAQSYQDVVKAEAEAKKAKTLGIIGIIAGLLGLLIP